MVILNKLKCIFGYHKYYLIFKIDCVNRKIGCRHCYKQFGMNDRVKAVVKWDGELEELYRITGRRYE